MLLLIVLAYSNTFNASWHLDDMTNIIHNSNIHISSLSIEEWVRSIRSPFSGPEQDGLNLYRPVSMLTLAMNWYLGGTTVFGYHLVNLAIHCLTAVLLFHVVLQLLKAPNVRDEHKGREVLIAFLAAALWALHPIQTQAVTYIVQRMASLAALFYLAGMMAYVQGRVAETKGKKRTAFGLCLLAYCLSIGSKQNGVTLPAALILIEIIFFSDFKRLRTIKGRWLVTGILAASTVLAGFILYLWPGNPSAGLFDGYDLRPFTLYERVLTQFRVLMLYLFQIIYPIPQQFSVIHAMALSKSPVTPWTTIPAVLGVGLLLGGAITCMRRFRLFAFAILFFFLGHSIESTILPLELVFEHRNYLPTLFLFLPVASGIAALMDFYRWRNKVLFGILAAFVGLLVTGIGFTTYTRNMAWATEKTLWQDAIAKAPSLARPYQALALAYESEGRLDLAYALYEKALALEDPDPENSRFNSLGNMGNILKKQKDYQGAVRLLKQAADLEKGPYANRVRYNLVLCLLNTGQEKEALDNINVLLEKNGKSNRYLNTKGFILLLQDDVERALHFLRMALRQNPQDMNTLLNLGMGLSASGAFERGAWYLKRAEERDPRNLIIHLSKLQNAILMQDDGQTRTNLMQIARLFNFQEIQHFFNEHSKGYHTIGGIMILLDDCIVLPPIVDYFERKAGEWVLDSGDPAS